MKTLIKKIFFKQQPHKLFPSVIIPVNGIKEKVYLENDTQKLDVSECHSIVCQTPFCIAVRIDREYRSTFSAGKLWLQIVANEKPVARLQVLVINHVKESNDAIAVLQIIKVRCYQLNLLKQYVVLNHFFKNKKHPYTESETYAAVYSYPRRIIITSFADKEYYNIFPMDFQGYYPGENLYLLGLRTTNRTLKKIIDSKKVVVSSIETPDIEMIYQLGAHHSGEPPKIDELPFKTNYTELFKIPVPAFAASYKELEIIQHYETGSHTMLVGKIVNAKKIKEERSGSYHIHFFEYTRSDYVEV
jgi:flavin reductase (DIM6/NTAB) family NADH-FMN oxidoreductase RutF